VVEDTATEIPLGIPFEIPYDPADIDEALTYTISATIQGAADELLFANPTEIVAITGGVPVEAIAVPVVPVETMEPEASMVAPAADPSAEASVTP
jgi:uncharacterized lipoprotein YbaY